jgi:ATP-binding cassette subfamily B protein
VSVQAIPDLTALEWRRDGGYQALRALGEAAGFPRRQEPKRQLALVRPGDSNDAASDLAQLVTLGAHRAGLDAGLVDVRARDAVESLRRAAPVLVNVNGHDGLLAVLRVAGKHASLLSPSGLVKIPTTVLRDALAPPVGAAAEARLSSMLQGAGFTSMRRSAVAIRVLAAPGSAAQPVAQAWSVRPVSWGLGDDLRGARFGRRLARIVVGYVAQFGLFLAIWRQVAARAFDPFSQPGAGGGGQRWVWFMAFLALWVIVQVATSAAVSRLALDIGARVRGGLMRGALQLDPGAIRTAGVGQLLGRALDAEALDALALGGGADAVAGVFELVMGGVLLATGAVPVWSLVVLGMAVTALGCWGWVYARRLFVWGQTRRTLTHDLVERMVGHRTALIQDLPVLRAHADDSALGAYETESRFLDRAEVWLSVVVPRGWLVAGLLVLAPLILFDTRIPGSAVAVSVGGVWMAYGAFRRLGAALPMLAGAHDAWGQISPLIGAVEMDPPPPAGARAAEGELSPSAQPNAPGPRPAPPLLLADNISFCYPGGQSPVLHGVNVVLQDGDRVLLQGASGGGKSTLAALLTGLKLPTSGEMRLRGVEQRSVGLAQWRGAIGGAPQFNDNHVFGADLLFNVLMGRRWPPRLQDVEAAERVCRDLGLGPLLDRMPAGLQQQVGETGWQLSHGERSRLFIARSLLQPLSARVLDESFAALDPATLDQVMGAVLARPEALIVIAHP